MFKEVFRLGLVFNEIYVCASYGIHFQPPIHSFFGPVIYPAFKYFYRLAALLAASILILLIFELCNDLWDELRFIAIRTKSLIPMAASSPRDFHYTRQALCNDWQDELKLIKSPPLSPAFLPRGFYSKCLALEIRNRHLPVNLFHFGYFFRRITA